MNSIPKKRLWSTQSTNPNKYLKNIRDFFEFLDDNELTQVKASKILYIAPQSLSQARVRGKISTLWLDHLKLIARLGEFQENDRQKNEEIKRLQSKLSEVQKAITEIQVMGRSIRGARLPETLIDREGTSSEVAK